MTIKRPLKNLELILKRTKRASTNLEKMLKRTVNNTELMLRRIKKTSAISNIKLKRLLKNLKMKLEITKIIIDVILIITGKLFNI
jgi:hypothetical protein